MKPSILSTVVNEIPTTGTTGKKRARVRIGEVWFTGDIETAMAGQLIKLSPVGGDPVIFIDGEHVAAIQQA